MTYINAISTISFQNLFEDKNLSNLTVLQEEDVLIQPNYKQWIKPMQLRRMSKIVRMGIGCTKDIIDQIKTQDFDSIIIGTGLGCIKDTVKFINTIHSVSTSSIPPTAFIQSTHNTIAGQIALLLSNNNYNMTYVQNGVSFEHALLDGQLKIAEGENNILVGGLDEMTDFVLDLAKKASIKNIIPLTEGSSFFNLVNNKDQNTFASLLKTYTVTIGKDFNIQNTIKTFLQSENLTLEDIDLIFSSSPFFNTEEKHQSSNKNNIEYALYCGNYFTNSGFGMYLACQVFKEDIKQINKVFNTDIKKLDYSLLINNYNDQVIGITLLKRA